MLPGLFLAVPSPYQMMYKQWRRREGGWRTGSLIGIELMFIFTDNATAESAYYKGSSDRRLLLVLCLHSIDKNGQVKLHVIHVAGS
jgi:hypothetical protein